MIGRSIYNEITAETLAGINARSAELSDVGFTLVCDLPVAKGAAERAEMQLSILLDREADALAYRVTRGKDLLTYRTIVRAKGRIYRNQVESLVRGLCAGEV